MKFEAGECSSPHTLAQLQRTEKSGGGRTLVASIDPTSAPHMHPRVRGSLSPRRPNNVLREKDSIFDASAWNRRLAGLEQ